jgi:enoyl-CoA hydratase/carnithine racemase
LTAPFSPEIRRAADELSTNEDVRVVVLRSSNPGFFIAHFDASLIREVPLEGEDLVRRRDDWTEMCEAFRTMPKATIAVIEGRIGGGGNELALACDMRFAARETAVFNQWEVAVGLLPGGGGLTRLARLMGRSRAMEANLACDDFDADLAERYGWVNRALPQAEMEPFIERLTSRIAFFSALRGGGCERSGAPGRERHHGRPSRRAGAYIQGKATAYHS